MLPRIRDIKFYLKLAHVKKVTRQINDIKNIAVLYTVPLNSKKKSSWHDGFTAAVNLLEKEYQIDWINSASDDFKDKNILNRLNSYDFIVVKTMWRNDIDVFLRENAEHITSPLGLMISGTLISPLRNEGNFYDVIWYETDWHYNRMKKHKNAFHGFGIDTSVMKEIKHIEKKYDWIMVGAPKKYKRVHKLIDKKGKKLFIGDLTNKDKESVDLLNILRSNDVEIIDFVSYEKLAEYYNLSRKCYVPTKLHGGGERSVLEARACHLDVEICDDNPKLAELLTSDIWDHQYYSQQLKKGINSIIKR